MPDANRHDAIIGMILGGAIGDVVGGIPERRTLALSDDTQLTLATCEAIIAVREVSASAIAARMLVWFREGRITGVGSSTLKAMRDLDAGAHWALSGAKGERAAGNGAAMRIAPLAFFLDPDVPRERVAIRDVARITHHNDEAYVGALAVVLAIRNPVFETIAASLPDSRVRDNLLVTKFDATLAEVASVTGSSGFSAETIPLAFAAAAAILRNGFESTLHALNEVGGDTDTIGSIAGQIAGAQVGVRGVPVHLLERVPGADVVMRVAEELAAIA